MSELINNREHRQEVLKEVIKELHAGKTVEEVKAKFAKVIEGVSPAEIGKMEVALVKEGLPVEEIQYLCDVHAEVFKGTLDEIHHPEQIPGHPVHTFKRENEALTKLVEEDIKPAMALFKEDDKKDNVIKLIELFNLLWDIDKHYSRKENLVFPYLEKYGVTAPPQVMWGVDDEVRAKLKSIKLDLKNYVGDKEPLLKKIDDALNQLVEMIFKEEKILFPMCLDTLTEDEWISIYNESDDIGYALVGPEKAWTRQRTNIEEEEKDKGLTEGGYVKFETGVLSIKELNLIFNNLPGDITFVDAKDTVKFFSNSAERIFARTKAVLGRSVDNCHPPASVHIVEKLVDDFKSGAKDSESFWIKMGDKFVLIQYFALRDENGDYLGTMEYTQNVKSIRDLTGEKRLVSE